MSVMAFCLRALAFGSFGTVALVLYDNAKNARDQNDNGRAFRFLVLCSAYIAVAAGILMWKPQ